MPLAELAERAAKADDPAVERRIARVATTSGGRRTLTVSSFNSAL
ncbi:hypothetical protein [Streptomyces sp. NPDC048111]